MRYRTLASDSKDPANLYEHILPKMLSTTGAAQTLNYDTEEERMVCNDQWSRVNLNNKRTARPLGHAADRIATPMNIKISPIHIILYGILTFCTSGSLLPHRKLICIAKSCRQWYRESQENHSYCFALAVRRTLHNHYIGNS